MRYYLPKGLTYNLISPDYPSENLINLKSFLLQAVSNEPDWDSGSNAVAGPITRWVEYSHGNVGAGKIWAMNQIANLGPGKPSPFFEALDNAVQDGALLVRGKGDSTTMAYIDGDIDEEWQEINRQIFVVVAGGDVVGLPVVFELDNITSICPFSTTGETWETWGVSGASGAPIHINGKWYRTSEVYGLVVNDGQPLPASAWFSTAMSGLKVITTKTFSAMGQEDIM